MNVLELDPIEASLENPDDPAEVTLIADAAAVGRTNRLATGQILTWTAEKLREFAGSMVGQPINVDLDEDDDGDEVPTGHTRRVVGAITESKFDETSQALRVRGSLWRHYFPSTVSALKTAFPKGKVNVSMEFTPTAELQSNGDGSETPTAGRFSGLGLVRRGADPRARAILMASVREDLERQPVEVQMNLDQITEAVARKLGYRQDEPDTATRAETDDAPADSEEVIASTEEDAPTTTQEDATLATELTEEQRASLREELLAELKPQLDELATVKAENETLKAKEAAREAADAKKELVATRMAELETILPADDAAKGRREALCAALDDEAFAAYKADIAAAAEVKGGIATDAARHEGTEEEGKGLTEEQIATMAGRALAASGNAAPAKDK